jgi:uncharacterized protein (DUF2236 family)
MTRKVNAERVVLLGWGRAVLLQFAHPLVAAGVADHSGFDESLVDFVRRTHGTIGAMLALTFGTEERARGVAARINAIHDRVHGTLAEPAGIFPAGQPYSARDPELLRWVHATLVDSMLLAWDWFVGPLAPQDKDRYCAEATVVEPLLGIPRGLLPARVADLHSYIKEVQASGAIVVTETARALAAGLLSPPLGIVGRPLVGLMRLTAIGLLPANIRSAYGFEWDAARERTLHGVATLLRGFRRFVPRELREWPEVRAA